MRDCRQLALCLVAHCAISGWPRPAKPSHHRPLQKHLPSPQRNLKPPQQERRKRTRPTAPYRHGRPSSRSPRQASRVADRARDHRAPKPGARRHREPHTRGFELPPQQHQVHPISSRHLTSRRSGRWMAPRPMKQESPASARVATTSDAFATVAELPGCVHVALVAAHVSRLAVPALRSDHSSTPRAACPRSRRERSLVRRTNPAVETHDARQYAAPEASQTYRP